MKVKWIKHESAELKLTIYENSATISNLYSKVRREGHATALMNKVCQWADDEDYRLQLVPGRFGHPIGPDNKVLIKFYESFGFVLYQDPLLMVRPRKKNTPYNEPS